VKLMTDTRPPRKAKKLATQQSVDLAIWAISDMMRRGNLTSGDEQLKQNRSAIIVMLLGDGAKRRVDPEAAEGSRSQGGKTCCGRMTACCRRGWLPIARPLRYRAE
jgi:hypothetical protein